ncbi:multiprotein-bridging factor 1 family protein [Hymenobacter sp. CRA2]|uniref:helix-turn-helix domain-containing protein n=1 Tax=Hymenobacter sp. CRA2 TaxID=1955620 RepID=UPI0020C9D0A5|nr:helix-turn-helix transcriptional regulator [Hymenobacter sp. CRA2]
MKLTFPTMNTLADLLAQTPPSEEDKRFVDKSMQLSGLIAAAMRRKGLTQKALADQLGKKESEVSRWLSGLHNFTLKSLTRLEAVLGEDLVLTFRDQVATATLTAPAKVQWAEAADTWQPPVRSQQPQRRTVVSVEEPYSLTEAA